MAGRLHEESISQPAGVGQQLKYLAGGPAISSFVVFEFAKFRTYPAIELLREFKVRGVKKRPGQMGQIHDAEH